VKSGRLARSELPDPAVLERFADLIVGFGANVQPGQIVELRSQIGREQATRAIAASCYRRGARFVDVSYFDSHIRRARVLFAPDDTLEFVPSWHRERVLQYGEQRCARIVLSGATPPGVSDGLDPERAAKDRWPFIAEYHKLIDDNTTNWCGCPGPSLDWAGIVYPELDADEAEAALWSDVFHMCRVDEPDPIAAWRERLDALSRAEAKLNEHRFDALHFQGPGTDLTLGLLPTSRWLSGVTQTVDGIPFMPNLPTEEVFTAPDPQRADGVVRSTKPLQLRGGTLLRDLVVRFEGGRAVQIDAAGSAEVLRQMCASDEGASRLGEVALVDREGRVGSLDRVFYTTLLDENAASHIALGSAYLETAGEVDRARLNESSIHVDFMLGGDDVDVTGITGGGERVPVLRDGRWQL
jgi:aminopeptidase